jgi:Tfp pilus assembly protein PilN
VRLTANELVIAPFTGHQADMKRARIIPLTHNEIVGTHIVNLTAIARHLAAAAHEYGISHPRLHIEAPFIDQTNPYTLLSLALCCSKQFTIEHISTAPNDKNLLTSFLPTGYQLTYRWAALFLLCCGIIGFTTYTWMGRLHHAVATQTKRLNTLHATKTSLQQQATKTRQLTQENNQLEKKLTHYTHLTPAAAHPERICGDIARALPTASKLVQLSLDQQATGVTIKGITTQPTALTGFIKKLAQQHTDYTFSLVNLKKQKHAQSEQGQEQQVFYAFTIQGLYTKSTPHNAHT